MTRKLTIAEMIEGMTLAVLMIRGVGFLTGRIHGPPSAVLGYIDGVWQLQAEGRLPVRSSVLDGLDLIR